MEWRHWIYVLGAEIKNNVKCIKVINSWGDKCGADGYQWLTEDHFTLGNCFTVVTFTYAKPEEPLRYTFNNDLKYKQEDKEVEMLQKILKLDGCFPANVPTATRYGDITKEAVKKFQLKYQVASPIILWWNGGKLVSTATRRQLNKLYGII